MLIGKYGASIIIMPSEIDKVIEYDFVLNENNALHINGIQNFLKKYPNNFKVNKSIKEDVISFNYVLELVMQGCIIIEVVVDNNGYASALYVPYDTSKITQEQIKWLRKNKEDLKMLLKNKYSLIKVLSKVDFVVEQTYSSTPEQRIKIIDDYFKKLVVYEDEDVYKSKGEIKC